MFDRAIVLGESVFGPLTVLPRRIGQLLVRFFVGERGHLLLVELWQALRAAPAGSLLTAAVVLGFGAAAVAGAVLSVRVLRHYIRHRVNDGWEAERLRAQLVRRLDDAGGEGGFARGGLPAVGAVPQSPPDRLFDVVELAPRLVALPQSGWVLAGHDDDDVAQVYAVFAARDVVTGDLFFYCPALVNHLKPFVAFSARHLDSCRLLMARALSWGSDKHIAQAELSVVLSWSVSLALVPDDDELGALAFLRQREVDAVIAATHRRTRWPLWRYYSSFLCWLAVLLVDGLEWCGWPARNQPGWLLHAARSQRYGRYSVPASDAPVIGFSD